MKTHTHKYYDNGHDGINLEGGILEILYLANIPS